MLFQNPRIPLSLLAKHYPNEYFAYGAADISLADETRWHLKNRMGYRHLDCDLQPTRKQTRFGKAASACALIPDFFSGGKIVEIGCAAGNRLALFKRLGWDSCVGIEYSGSAAATARNRGLEVITGPVEIVIEDFPECSLNAIVGGFVIEHVADPYALTRRIAAKLMPGGQFLFSTVNIESPDFQLYGSYWYNLDLPRHMVLFRKQDLHAMLSRDFEIEGIYFQSSPSDYLVSARYRLDDGVRGWRRWLDMTFLRFGPWLSRSFSRMARAGYGARVFVVARKK